MVCPCCVPTQLCCCEGDNVRVVQNAQDCTGTVAPPLSPPIDVNDISFVFEWGGMTVVCDTPFISGGRVFFSCSDIENVVFSCALDGFVFDNSYEPFDTYNRTALINIDSFYQLGTCPKFNVQVTLFFNGTTPSTGFGAGAQVQRTTTLSECRTSKTVTIGTDPFWCSDNPYGGTFTVTLVIAP